MNLDRNSIPLPTAIYNICRRRKEWFVGCFNITVSEPLVGNFWIFTFYPICKSHIEFERGCNIAFLVVKAFRMPFKQYNFILVCWQRGNFCVQFERHNWLFIHMHMCSRGGCTAFAVRRNAIIIAVANGSCCHGRGIAAARFAVDFRAALGAVRGVVVPLIADCAVGIGKDIQRFQINDIIILNIFL